MADAPREPRKGGVMYVLPKVPEGADDALREAIEARNAASLTGTCPACGATGKDMGRDHREVRHGVIEHEADCPAHDENIAPMIRDHAARGFKIEDEAIYVEPPPDE